MPIAHSLKKTAEQQSGLEENSSLLWLLALVNFLVGLGAFLVVGLFSSIQIAFELSVTQAGLLISFYSLVYAIGSPIGVALTGSLDRKTLLIGCMLVFALSIVLITIVTSYAQLIAVRSLSALAAGIITPVTASIAITSSVANNTGRSLSRVFLGFTAAQALGVPLGTYLGNTYGWEIAFLMVFVMTLLATIVLQYYLEKNIAFSNTDFPVLIETLIDSKLLVSLLCTTSFIVGIYVLYTFLEPIAVQLLDFDQEQIAVLFLVFGFGAVFGNHLGGILNDRIGSYSTLRLLCVIQILLAPFFSLLNSSVVVFFALTFVWSVFGWAFMIAQQSRLAQLSPDRQSVLLSLNAAAIYTGAAIGATLGGQVIALFGIEMLGFAAGLIGLFALWHLLRSEQINIQ